LLSKLTKYIYLINKFNKIKLTPLFNKLKEAEEEEDTSLNQISIFVDLIIFLLFKLFGINNSLNIPSFSSNKRKLF